MLHRMEKAGVHEHEGRHAPQAENRMFLSGYPHAINVFLVEQKQK